MTRTEKEFIKKWEQIRSAARVVCALGGGTIRIEKVGKELDDVKTKKK